VPRAITPVPGRSSLEVNVADKPVIVVADDDPQIGKLISYRLQKMGFEVHVGDDGGEALAMILSLVPSLVVLDLMMPVMNGFEVLRAMKEEESTRHIPAIILTAREADEDVIKGFELGAVDYMTKPFSPAELGARVKASLNGRH
jgi:DNA-binding response OmpR family regulator